MFSFQDDYLKNMEENTGSDESKSEKRLSVALMCLEDECVVSCQVLCVFHLQPECICRDSLIFKWFYLNNQLH